MTAGDVPKPATGRATPAKPKADTNGEAKLTAERLLARARPERTVEVDLEGETVTLVFRAIGRKDYDDLVAAHPPDPAVKTDRAAGWPWDIETFAPALIAACLVEPQLSTDEATVIWREWETAVVDEIFGTVLAICTDRPQRAALGKDWPTPGSPTPSSPSSPATP